MTMDAPTMLVQKPRRRTVFGDGGSDHIGDDITPPAALATIVIDPTQPDQTQFYFGSSVTNWPVGTYEIRYLTGASQYQSVHPWVVNLGPAPGRISFLYNGILSNQPLPTLPEIYDTQAAVEAAFAALVPPGTVIINHNVGGTISGLTSSNPLFNLSGNPNPTFELWPA